jgi:hypothetical protein
MYRSVAASSAMRKSAFSAELGKKNPKGTEGFRGVPLGDSNNSSSKVAAMPDESLSSKAKDRHVSSKST